jgi:hypothetical protein
MPLILAFYVELPGIEPGSEIKLTCENSGIDNAKRRQTTPRRTV